MRMIYTNDNRMLVGNIRNILEAEGLELIVKNEFASGVIGEVSAFDAWVELWVRSDADYDRACAILDRAFSRVDEKDWRCRDCDETNGAAFELCWRCRSEKPQTL